MKNSLFISIFFICSYFCNGQGWQSLSNFNDARDEATSFVINNKMYVFGGSPGTPNQMNDLWEYNTLTDVWTQKAPCPCDARTQAVAFTLNNKGYIATGYNQDQNQFYNDFWEYDPTLNNWTQKASLVGAAARLGAVAFVINNRAYVGGGITTGGVLTDDLWEYDASLNYWLPRDTCSSIGRWAASFVLGDKAYVGLGRLTGGVPNNTSFYSYDQLSNTWSQIADFTGGARTGTVSFSYSGQGYVGWGDEGTGTNAEEFYTYDTISNGWQYAFSFPFAGPRRNAVSNVVNGVAYMGLSTGSDFWSYTFSITGTNEIENNKSIEVYPNPGNGRITVKCNYNIMSVEIFNLLGEKIYSTFNFKQQTSEIIDLSSSPKGIYFVKIYDGYKTHTENIVIQ